MDLEECFIKYNNITSNVMEAVKLENYEKLHELFGQRQLMLNNISSLSCSKEEIRKFYLKYNISELEKTVEAEMKKRKDEILEKIKESQRRKKAMNGYNNLQARGVFLSKEF